jgi:hypothetical protein
MLDADVRFGSKAEAKRLPVIVRSSRADIEGRNCDVR